MSSTEPRRLFTPRTLVARMAYATAAAAGLSALLASLTALAVADHLVRDAEDRRLRGVVADVLRELPSGVSSEAFARAVDEEVNELEPSGLRIVVRHGDEVLGGDTTLPDLSPGACTSYARRRDTVRACGGESRGLAIVAASVRAAYGATTVALACLVSVAIAAMAAAFAGRRAARWALAPLLELRGSLDAVAADAPERADLAGDDTCDEVAALRGALTQLVRRLGASLRAARGFSAEAAHELKTPLTTLRAELDLLAEEPLGADARAAVARLQARVLILGQLIDRLLVLATVTDGSQLSRQTVAMEDVVGEVLARREAAQRARVTVHSEGPGMVRGDESLLGALVENVVDNALKFSQGPVEIALQETENAVVVEVRDHGPGVSKETRERAFEAFYRAAEVRGTLAKGHGIGLALVAQVVAAHGGSVAFVEPETGGGARLRLELPPWRPSESADSGNRKG